MQPGKLWQLAEKLLGLHREYAVRVYYRQDGEGGWYYVAADESLTRYPGQARWYTRREAAEEAGDPTWLGLDTQIKARAVSNAWVDDNVS